MFLFETSEFTTSDATTPKEITFYSYNTTIMRAAVTPITRLYSDFENEQLEIKFGAAYGHYPPQPISEK